MSRPVTRAAAVPGAGKLSKAQWEAAQQLSDGLHSTAIKPAILNALVRAGVAERHVPTAGHIMFRHEHRLTDTGRLRLAARGREGSG